MQGERSTATAPANLGEWDAVVSEGDNDSDAAGAGERSAASGRAPRDSSDILPDRIIAPPEEEPDCEAAIPGIEGLADDAQVDQDDGDSDSERATR